MTTEELKIEKVRLSGINRDTITFDLNDQIEIEGKILGMDTPFDNADLVVIKVEGYNYPFTLPFGTTVYITGPQPGDDEANAIMLSVRELDPKHIGKWVAIVHNTTPHAPSMTKVGKLVRYDIEVKGVRHNTEEKVLRRTTAVLEGGRTVTENELF